MSDPRNTLIGLRELSEKLASVPQRRKAVVFVSTGIPIEIGESLSQGGTRELMFLWNDALIAARRANVNIHPVDPSGLTASPLIDDIDRIKKQQDFLMATAANTGGRAFVNSNEFKSKVDQIFSETASFHLLGYSSSNQAEDGKFRRIKVTVRKPGVTIHTRAG